MFTQRHSLGTALRIGVAAAALAAPTLSDAHAAERAAPTTEPPVEKFQHRGFVLDASAGVGGCTRGICRGGNGHRAQPGLFARGFVGGNIGGWVELGVGGGWGRVRARPETGHSPIRYWGLSPRALDDKLAMAKQLVDVEAVDRLASAHTERATLSTYHAAPMLRIHAVPRGRALVFAGAGAGYGAARGDYATDLGRLSLTAHGLAVPIEAGLGVHLSDHVAMIAKFDYVWTRYFALSMQSGPDALVLPTSMCDVIAADWELQTELPDTWSISLGMRVRLF